jgi:hypothetical protein
MEQTKTEPEVQEQQTAAALRPWVTPSFERMPLKDASFEVFYPGSDGSYGGSSYS